MNLKRDVYQSWTSGARNVVAVSPTGSGKSLTMASMAFEFGENTCAIAHRQELVQQISIAMAQVGLPHNIIAPDKVISTIISRHIVEFGKSYLDRRSRMTVVGVDTLIRRKDDKSIRQWANTVRYWQGDECFPAGTLVDGTPIENVKVGDKVTAFDETTGQLSSRPVTHVFKNPMPDEMVRIDIGHHVIYATSEHPFWTDAGWVNAKDLTSDHTLYADALFELRQNRGGNQRITEVSLAEVWDDILFSNLWLRTSGSKSNQAGIGPYFDDLSYLWKTSGSRQSNDAEIPEDWARVLWGDLLSDVPVKTIIGNHGENQSNACFGANEEKQPDVSRIGQVEGFGDLAGNEAWPENKRWERKTTYSSRTEIDRALGRSRVRLSARAAYRVWEPSWSNALQDRLCESTIEDRDRSRWTESFVVGQTEVGQEEGRLLAPTRVVGVTVLERGHPDFPAGDFVYNIEVDGLNTYFADGIAVHNCHHFLQNNKWGTAVQMFPNARGVGFTATPIRCDRKSLHVEQGGVFDDLVVGPSMRELIDLGFLADYMIYGPPISIDEAKLHVSKNTGEFTPASLKSAEDHSTLHGDIVQHYLKLAAGKRGITFVHSVDAATDVANKFRQAGVPAECVSAKTPDAVRNSVIDKFRKGTVMQLVNVDLFGEGFDVPAVEVVSMGRATQSFGLYVQQLGRALRPMDGKDCGIIIDHVGNVKRHGLPDAVKTWSLKADERGRKRQVVDEEVIPVTSCTACFATYERIHKQCPFCGHVEEPAARNDPKFVDGDLIEFGPELLAELRRQAASVVAPFDATHDVPVHLRGTPAEWAIKKRYETRREAHGELADTIALWAGVRRDRGMADSEIYRRFYHMFGVDVATAQTLRELKAIEDLTTRIKENYWT